jgi:hypothetical protein
MKLNNSETILAHGLLTRRSSKVLLLQIVFLLLFFPNPSFGGKPDKKTTITSRVLNVRPGWIDLYVVNSGDVDLPTEVRPDRFYLGNRISFVFFTKQGECATCRFSTHDQGFRLPSNRNDKLLPGELAGISLTFQELDGFYNFKMGCYGLFVEFKRPVANKLEVTGVTNASKICLN